MSETDRWIKLARKALPFCKTLEEYLCHHHQECTCELLVLGNVALSVPNEVMSLVKKRKPVEFKPHWQEQPVDAHEYAHRLRILFVLIVEDVENVNVGAKGTMDISHIVRIQFIYKHFLR
jgi:hypothetical protein